MTKEELLATIWLHAHLPEHSSISLHLKAEDRRMITELVKEYPPVDRYTMSDEVTAVLFFNDPSFGVIVFIPMIKEEK